MPSATLNWVIGSGQQPPPPYGPDRQKGFVWYRGQRKPSLDFTVDNTTDTYQMNNLAGGEYTVRIYSEHEAEISLNYAVKSFQVQGTLIAPEGGNDPPAGNGDIAPPSDLEVTVNP